MVMDTSFLHSPFFQGVRAEGFEEGEAVGELKGEAKGRATAILEVLLCRGVATSPKNRERIETCMDLAALSTWLRNAMTANTIDEVFG